MERRGSERIGWRTRLAAVPSCMQVPRDPPTPLIPRAALEQLLVASGDGRRRTQGWTTSQLATASAAILVAFFIGLLVHVL